MISRSWRKWFEKVFPRVSSPKKPFHRYQSVLEMESLEDRMMPTITPQTITVLGLGDTLSLSNLTHVSGSHWTAPNLRSAIVNAGQTGTDTDIINVPTGTINLVPNNELDIFSPSN